MTHRAKLTITCLTATMLLVGAACGSDTVDDAGDAAEDVSEQIDESAEEVDETSGDLAQVLRDNGLDSIASVIDEVDVAELVGTDEFTFFAPSDDAFQALDADAMADLLANPTELDDVLRRHLVAETMDAAALSDMSSVDNEDGTSLDVVVEGETVMVGDAAVTTADIEVDNGVVHVVDRIFVDA